METPEGPRDLSHWGLWGHVLFNPVVVIWASVPETSGPKVQQAHSEGKEGSYRHQPAHLKANILLNTMVPWLAITSSWSLFSCSAYVLRFNPSLPLPSLFERSPFLTAPLRTVTFPLPGLNVQYVTFSSSMHVGSQTCKSLHFPQAGGGPIYFCQPSRAGFAFYPVGLERE